MSVACQVIHGSKEAILGHHKAPHQKTQTLHNYNAHTGAKHN